MSRQGSKRLISLSTVSLTHCCQESHNEDRGESWDLPHTQIFTTSTSYPDTGCCFTPFIYLVRVELESTRVSKTRVHVHL
jgi:hypothetical protein